MYKLLFIVVLAGFFISVESQFGRQCDVATLTTCQNNFQTLTGIDLRRPWQEVRRAIENGYAGLNDTNFRMVCRGFYELGGCMRENFYACYNIPYLVQNNSLALQDAYNYLSIFLQSHFTCAAGFNVFLQNEGCFLNAWRTHRTTFDICYNLYETQIVANLGNPDSRTLCALGSSFKTCIELIFDSACGGLLDSIWWGCEYARVNVITQFPFCSTADFRCVQSAPPSS
uniref:Uncharacterized protein n=1 Tax=Acrobeloides nanus TaxID=290746 RepID=A0A914BWI8_9BILA